MTSRITKAISNEASDIAGMISAALPVVVRKPVCHQPRSTTSPRPKAGSHCSSTEKVRISRMPITNAGTETSTIDMMCRPRASGEFGLMAA